MIRSVNMYDEYTIHHAASELLKTAGSDANAIAALITALVGDGAEVVERGHYGNSWQERVVQACSRIDAMPTDDADRSHAPAELLRVASRMLVREFELPRQVRIEILKYYNTRMRAPLHDTQLSFIDSRQGFAASLDPQKDHPRILSDGHAAVFCRLLVAELGTVDCLLAILSACSGETIERASARRPPSDPGVSVRQFVQDMGGVDAVFDAIAGEFDLELEGEVAGTREESTESDEHVEERSSDIDSHLLAWLGDRTKTTLAEVLESCLRIPLGASTRMDQVRVAQALRRIGWERYRMSAVNGRRQGWGYRRRDLSLDVMRNVRDGAPF